MEVEETLSQSSDQQQDQQPGKRHGSHGSFKKSDKYITDPASRKNKEKAKIASIRRNIRDAAVLTKMPSAFFAFSEGKVEVIGSTKAMKEFLNDESIKRRFLECAKANPEVESSDDEEPIAESSPSSKQESATYPLEEGWNTGNVHKKRKVIRDIVVWDSGLGDAFKWDKERTPFWWPSNLTFGNMKSVNVASCDRILYAYRKMLIKSRINQITEMPNQPWLELKKWADTTVEEVDLVVDWVKCDWQEPTINKRFVSRRFRSVTSDWIASSEREPFWWPNLTKSLSFAVFATSKEEKFIKNLALAACIKDFSALLNFVREGTDSIDASQIKTWLNVDGDFNTEAYIVKDHLMNISSASGLTELFADE